MLLCFVLFCFVLLFAVIFPVTMKCAIPQIIIFDISYTLGLRFTLVMCLYDLFWIRHMVSTVTGSLSFLSCNIFCSNSTSSTWYLLVIFYTCKSCFFLHRNPRIIYSLLFPNTQGIFADFGSTVVCFISTIIIIMIIIIIRQDVGYGW